VIIDDLHSGHGRRAKIVSTGTVVALLAIAVGLFGTATTVLLFALSRLLGKLDAAQAENKLLLAGNWDLKLSVIELKGVSHALDRTLSSLPTAARQEGSSP
jgi:hypothetical protein